MSALARRLDRIEAVLRAALSAEAGPIYLREGEAIPAEIDPERVVTIKRVFIDPPDMPAEQLPEIVEASPAIERASPSFTRPLTNPEIGIV